MEIKKALSSLENYENTKKYRLQAMSGDE